MRYFSFNTVDVKILEKLRSIVGLHARNFNIYGLHHIASLHGRMLVCHVDVCFPCFEVYGGDKIQLDPIYISHHSVSFNADLFLPSVLLYSSFLLVRLLATERELSSFSHILYPLPTVDSDVLILCLMVWNICVLPILGCLVRKRIISSFRTVGTTRALVLFCALLLLLSAERCP